MSEDNLTIIENGKILFSDESSDIYDVLEYCEEECQEKCRMSFASDGTGCDCVVNRLYVAMVRLAELEHGWARNEP